MPDYRLYAVNKENHLEGPPAVLFCANDAEAIVKAGWLTYDCDIEVWEANRRVRRLRAASNQAKVGHKP
jgi:hypothetical protein